MATRKRLRLRTKRAISLRLRKIRTAHWAEIKATNRRVVLDIDNGEYKDLKPIANFVARL